MADVSADTYVRVFNIFEHCNVACCSQSPAYKSNICLLFAASLSVGFECIKLHIISHCVARMHHFLSLLFSFCASFVFSTFALLQNALLPHTTHGMALSSTACRQMTLLPTHTLLLVMRARGGSVEDATCNS